MPNNRLVLGLRPAAAEVATFYMWARVAMLLMVTCLDVLGLTLVVTKIIHELRATWLGMNDDSPKSNSPAA